VRAAAAPGRAGAGLPTAHAFHSLSTRFPASPTPPTPHPPPCSHEGVCVGPSAALNAVAAVKAARELGPGHTVVTVLCDSGDRYRSKLYSAAWLSERGLAVGDVDSEAARAGITFVR